LPRKPHKRGGSERHPGVYQDNIPFLSLATGRARPSTPSCLRSTAPSIGAALTGVVTCENHLICDGGRAIDAFARKSNIPLHAGLVPGKPTAEAPHLHLHLNNVNAYDGRLKQWLSRFSGAATKDLPN
jgi:hypothetical protein